GLATTLASYDGAAELESSLDILLTGLTTTLTPIPSKSRTRKGRNVTSAAAENTPPGGLKQRSS
ncbi:hypothetical protein AB0D08_40165, partial [Kitasatospora sp. NPDC048540]|uniref:hypothetical protein n=1 Tax=Kitasatospora sp. NPDC048540 TaxID=3155634 RepID=UPI0033D5F7FB